MHEHDGAVDRVPGCWIDWSGTALLVDRKFGVPIVERLRERIAEPGASFRVVDQDQPRLSARPGSDQIPMDLPAGLS
jgi:hypothetical protein